MFGKDVVDRVRQGYGDAFQTAHFEVPGEMFALAMEAKQRGMGVVGSTSNILDFIKKHVSESLKRGFEDRLQFVLGTESGMVTSIVGGVRKLLDDHKKTHGTSNVEVEIVFPVSSEAVSATSSSTTNGAYESTLAKLPIVPGVASGEGCSISGGCASCHYMKVSAHLFFCSALACKDHCEYLLTILLKWPCVQMNTLNSLLRVCRLVGTAGEPLLTAHHARAYTTLIDGQTLGDLGCEPILHMRQFQVIVVSLIYVMSLEVHKHQQVGLCTLVLYDDPVT
jgi:quinolinate synthase